MVLEKCFLPDASPLPGDYRAAMSQQVTSGKPVSHTPLHILCSGGDIKFQKKAIVKLLVENGIVSADDFADVRMNKFTV